MRVLPLLALVLVPSLVSCSGLSPSASSNQPGLTPPPTNVTSWTADTTVGTIVAERPQTARIFDLVGIDYCCGGQAPLKDAAAAQKADLGLLLSALQSVGVAAPDGADRNWQEAELAELIDHIVSTHHAWLRRELPQLASTAQTVLKVHGQEHPELEQVVATIHEVNRSVLPHLDDEEQRVFPAMLALAAGKLSVGVAELIDELHDDHDELGGALERLRALTNGFEVPAGACAKYREMLSGLAALERDMHTHVHLENNVLLPRTRSLLDARQH